MLKFVLERFLAFNKRVRISGDFIVVGGGDFDLDHGHKIDIKHMDSGIIPDSLARVYETNYGTTIMCESCGVLEFKYNVFGYKHGLEFMYSLHIELICLGDTTIRYLYENVNNPRIYRDITMSVRNGYKVVDKFHYVYDNLYIFNAGSKLYKYELEGKQYLTYKDMNNALLDMVSIDMPMVLTQLIVDYLYIDISGMADPCDIEYFSGMLSN